MLASSLPVCLSDIHKWVSPYIPEELVRMEHKDTLFEFISNFPDFLYPDFLVYETPMIGSKRFADLSFCFKSSSFDFAQLQSFSAKQGSWQWKNLSCFLEWGINEGVFKKAVIDAVIIEFDLEFSASLAEPNVIIALGGNRIDINQLRDLASSAFKLLRGKELSEKSLSYLQKCAVMGFEVKTLAFMLGRSSSGVRFRIGHASVLSSSELISYLKGVNYPCLSEAFFNLYDQLTPFLKETELYLGVDDVLLPRIDLFITEKNLVQENKASWEAVLKFLVKKNLVSKNRCDALLAFIGHQLEPTQSALMNPSLFSLNKKEPEHTIFRRLGMIKLVFCGDSPPLTKAYFTPIASDYTKL